MPSVGMLCMYVSVREHMCISEYACVCVSVHTCRCSCVQVNVHMCVYVMCVWVCNVCVCLCAHRCSCVQVNMHVCGCVAMASRRQPPLLFPRHRPPPFQFPLLLSQGLSLAWNSPCNLGWLAGEPRNLPFSTCPTLC